MFFCRVFPLDGFDFASVLKTAQAFSAPVEGFSNYDDAVAWTERVLHRAYQPGSEPALISNDVATRIGLLQLAPNIFASISSFSSLAGLTRNFLERTLNAKPASITVDLTALMLDQRSNVVGVTYEEKSGRLIVSKPPTSRGDILRVRALSLAGHKTGPIEIGEALDMSLNEKADFGDIFSDIRETYGYAKNYMTVRPEESSIAIA
jgi:hypothetical protein